MLIELEPKNYGGVVVSAVSMKKHTIIKKYMRDMNGKQEDGTAFFQSIEEAAASIELSPSQVRRLSHGWNIRLRMDTWSALHIWGYDAHTLSERGEI